LDLAVIMAVESSIMHFKSTHSPHIPLVCYQLWICIIFIFIFIFWERITGIIQLFMLIMYKPTKLNSITIRRY